MAQKTALLVCLGNICRSPIAEACLKKQLDEKGMLSNWLVDSAATSRYEIGSPPDERGEACLRKHNMFHFVEKHRARQVVARDFDTFDYIFVMDDQNMRDLKAMAPRRDYRAQLLMLGSFDDDPSFEGIIEDPYYGRDADFDVVFLQCMRSCANFLKKNSTA